MAEIPLLKDIFVIFGLAIAVVLACHLVRVPTIVGFLVTGILAGPHGLGLVDGVHDVEVLAEVGVILLLFAIGIEFSLGGLREIRKFVLVGGCLQVLLTAGTVWVLAVVFGQPPMRGLFVGFVVSLSSTAIVLKILQERSEVGAPHGRGALGVLIFQDIAIVPMMLLVPMMSGTETELTTAVVGLVLKAAAIILMLIVSMRWAVPWLLARVARTRSDELFLLSIAVICFGVAWLTHQLGLSLALGAFLAGLIISESDYSHRALGNVLPFRDVFTSFFFVSIGMLLNVEFAMNHVLAAVGVAFGVLVLKTVVGAAASLILGMPLRVAILVGLAVGQVGEFSFVLSSTGVTAGVLTEELYQFFLVVSLLTMAATPFVLAGSQRIADALCVLPWPERWLTGRAFDAERTEEPLEDHIIIVGFGVAGRNLARSASLSSIPYQIVEINDRTVREEKQRGEPIFYGDATQPAVMLNAGLKTARVVVVAVPDPMGTRRVVEVVRRLRPNVHIIVRVRYVGELEQLRDLGANEVVPEEFEASMAIFSRVLEKYLVPSTDIERYVREARAEGYQSFYDPFARGMESLGLSQFDADVRVFRLDPKAELVGATLSEIGLRQNYDVSVLMVRRAAEVISNPPAELEFRAGDVVVVLGRPEKVASAAGLFEG